MERLKNEALAFAKKQVFSAMATVEKDKPWARVMAQARIDDDFSVWYATFSFSNKVSQVKKNDQVCITMNEGNKDLRIFGKAEIYDDKETKHAMWKEDWTRYFKEGKDDPSYVLVKVVAEKVEYRDMEKYGIMPVDIQT